MGVDLAAGAWRSSVSAGAVQSLRGLLQGANLFDAAQTCRPPSNSVRSQISTIRSISRSPSISADRQSTFESLWRRLISAVRSSWPGAARMPGSLLAAMCMPIPVPQIRIAALGLALGNATGCGGSNVRIIDALATVGAVILDFVPQASQQIDDLLLDLDAAMIAADGHTHRGAFQRKRAAVKLHLRGSAADSNRCLGAGRERTTRGCANALSFQRVLGTTSGLANVATSATAPILRARSCRAAAATGREPANQRPHQPGQPTGENIGRIMNAEIDTTRADNQGNQHGDGEHVHLLAGARAQRRRRACPASNKPQPTAANARSESCSSSRATDAARLRAAGDQSSIFSV